MREYQAKMAASIYRTGSDLLAKRSLRAFSTSTVATQREGGSPTATKDRSHKTQDKQDEPKSVFVPRTSFDPVQVSTSNFTHFHREFLKKGMSMHPHLTLELRDARAPLSTGNVLLSNSFSSAIGSDRLYLYSKSDASLLDDETLKQWHPQGNYLQIDCRSRQAAVKIMKYAATVFQKIDPPPPVGFNMLICGMPNVGKSTLVNTMRRLVVEKTSDWKMQGKKRSVAPVGQQAGVTRALSNRIKVCDSPNIFVFDSPGLFMPSIANSETMIKLALLKCIKESLVDPIVQADYLLYALNRDDPKSYRYLCPPTNDINDVLYALRRKWRTPPEQDAGTALRWINEWVSGKKGKVMLDAATPEAFDDYNQKESERMRSWMVKFQQRGKEKGGNRASKIFRA
ncbi:Mitochondrial GTPase 1 [Yarrowia sp. B02]|nr:Mitochondrial GTPase 1 [Yarrowia sp. B02]